MARSEGVFDGGPSERGRFPFPGYPRGWFAVAFSGDVAPGAARAVRYFGRELVVFRTESGRASVTSAYCPHLGAHLGHGGVVEGETIRCPFHGWRFEGDGRCVAIPYASKIPPRARLAAMPTREQNGVIFVFHDAERGAPTELPALEEEGWTPARTVLWAGLRTHAQEVFENTVDVAHLGPVHDGRGGRLVGAPTRDGDRLDVSLEFDAPGDVVGMPGTLNHVCLDVSLLGLGHVVVQTNVTTADVRARQRIYATPIDEASIDLRGVVQVRETDDPVFTEELAQIFYDAYVEDFAKDFPIWENKRYLSRPMLAKGDGPIAAYRRWCAGLYPAPSAAPDVPRDRLTEGRPSRDGAAVEGLDARAAASRFVEAVRAEAGARLGSALSRLEARVFGGSARTPEAMSATDEPDSTTTSATPRAAVPSEEVPREAVPFEAVSEATPGHGAPTAQSPTAQSPAAQSPTAKLPVASVEHYVETLGHRFVPSAARGVDAVFQWELAGEGGSTFHARVRDGSIEVVRGAHPKPTVTLSMPADDYVRVVNGELDGMRAFTTGRGKVSGSVRVAMKMRALFPQ